MSTTQHKILVQGGAGHAGLHILKSLTKGLKGKENFTLVAGFTDYHAKNCPKVEALGLQCMKLDLNEEDTINNALKGVTCVVMQPPYLPNRDVLCNRFIDKCVHAGVKHVFLLSITAAATQAFHFAKQMAGIETKLINSGLKYTIIRMPMYQESTLIQKTAIKEGSFFMPTGEYKMPLVCVCDVGDVIAKISLNLEGHNNKILDITGPENLSGTDIAKVFSNKLGKQVNLIKVSCEQWKEKIQSFGFSNFKADALGQILEWYSKGNGRTTNEFTQLMGKEATTFEKFVELKKDEILA